MKPPTINASITLVVDLKAFNIRFFIRGNFLIPAPIVTQPFMNSL